MLTFPNCKINLGLRILGKRPDGYHNLETIFYPIGIKDALEITSSETVTFNRSGIRFENEDNNLCVKAYNLLKADYPDIPPVDIHLLKCIPIGAGLGGGSSDAAAMLLMLNERYKLDLSVGELLGYALKLGSDCPFFILNRPCYGTGRGEQLDPVEVDLSMYTLVIVNPGIHISTAEAFSRIMPSIPAISLCDIAGLPIGEWKYNMINDFEKPVFEAYPGIRDIKEKMYAHGALYASMSGSGSTVFGVFDKEKSLPVWKTEYFVRVVG